MHSVCIFQYIRNFQTYFYNFWKSDSSVIFSLSRKKQIDGETPKQRILVRLVMLHTSCHLFKWKTPRRQFFKTSVIFPLYAKEMLWELQGITLILSP